MTAQELAQQIIALAQEALEKEEQHMVVYIGDNCEARIGLEAIIKLCQDVPASQEAYKQYEKKERVKP